MPLSLPNLDTRRWSDLVEEGLALIPRYAPAWTDHNATDPGITILELLAFLVEQDIYWLNRIPERHRRKFLALAGVTPNPPTPSSVVLAFPLAGGGPAVTVEAGTVWEAPGRGLSFAATAPLLAVSASLASVAADGTDLSAAWREARPIAVFGDDPQPGATFALSFDQPLRSAEEVSLWFGVTRPLPAPPPAGTTTHHSVTTVWEVRSGDDWIAPASTVDDTVAFTMDGFVRLTPTADTTTLRCRYVSGTFDAMPSLRAVVANAVLAEEAVPVFQTYEVAPGATVTGAPPPASMAGLGAVEVDEHGRLSAVAFVAVGTTGVPHVAVTDWAPPDSQLPGRVTLDAVLVGRSPGWPNHVFDLPDEGRVAHGLVEVWTIGPDGAWTAWAVRADLDAAGPADTAVAVDFGTGRVRFGDGYHGLVPVRGSLVFARFRRTTGRAGDVAGGTHWSLADHPANRVLGVDPMGLSAAFPFVVNPVGSSGGTDAETIGSAAARAAANLWASERLVELAAAAKASSLDQLPSVVTRVPTPPRRATTLLDIERIALAVPGVRVARCRARAAVDARFACLQAPGTVTLIVIPELPPHRPFPSAELLAAVRAAIEERRVIGTRLLVSGPRYVEVSVQARVSTRAGADAERVQRDVTTALDTFLDPLAGGDVGHGWPFGRDVYRSEVLRVIDDVVGVDHVTDLDLRADQGEAQCGNLCLGPADLATPGTHDITMEATR